MKHTFNKVSRYIKQQKNGVSVNIFCLIVCGSVFISVLGQDVFVRSKILQQNEVPARQLYPYYGFQVVPNSITKSTPSGSLGSDFSQVYFAAKAARSGESPYTTTNPSFMDGLGRPPNYPPLTNWLYGGLANITYSAALLIHTYGTILLFLLVSIFAIGISGNKRYLGKVLLVYTLLYWYTTMGYAHFERGQFDFWTASFFTLIFTYVYFYDRK